MRCRVLEPELMDDPALDHREHVRALRGLARINQLSDAGRSMWREVAPTARRLATAGSRVRWLDIATGSGDVPLGVAAQAIHAGVDVELVLCDVSATALAVARSSAARSGIQKVHTQEADVVAAGLPFDDGEFSIVTCSLFMHHLREDDVARVMREMARVVGPGGQVAISDLRRCPPGLLAAWLAGRVLTRSHIVRVDAVRSVRAAFTIEEMRSMAEHAGLARSGSLRVSANWPWRIMLSWSAA